MSSACALAIGGCDARRVERRRLRRRHPRPVVERRLVAELADRQVGLDHPALFDDEALAVGRLADDGEIEPPFAEDRLGLRLLFGLEHHQHALLALGEHHLVGAHAFFAAGQAVEVEFDAEVALGAHLDRRRGQPRRAHVLDRDDRARRHQFEAGFKQQLFGERIADLHRRPLRLRVGLERGRGHRRAVDAVAAGLGAEIDDRVPDPGRLGVENRVGARDADRHRVDQDVAVVALVEADRAADRRHAERIAVAADARHHAGDEMAGLGMVGRAEAQEVEARHRPRAHGEDVAQDAADPGRRALIGLDERGVVVALHLEDDRVAVADVDDAGVLARALDHPRGLGRQFPQMEARRLVGTMLVPHRRDDAELGVARRAPDQGDEPLIFLGFQPMADRQRLVDLRFFVAQIARPAARGRIGGA